MTCIRFHIGAHKTATTHLQMTLAGCRLDKGTRYFDLRWLRRSLTSPVRKGRPRLSWHRWYGGTWLFSDENILGTTRTALRMYPDPARALRYFNDTDLRIFLCVRCYDTFLASAYGERLWRHRFRPFRESIPERRWPDVVRDLRRELPEVPVHVWRYEDYRHHARAIVQYYAGDAVTAFGAEPPADPKSGFSARAVSELARSPTSRPGKARIRQVRRQYPVSDACPRFDPWSVEQKQRLREMYADDLVALEGLAEIWKPGKAGLQEAG